MTESSHTDILSIEQQVGTSQFLTFKLGTEEYGVDILKVQEIRSWEPVTTIPNTPDYVLGVVNLRGTVVPVMDLRRRFQLEDTEFHTTTVVIVVKIEHEGRFRTVGMVADAVSEVYNVVEEDVSETPDIGGAINVEFMKGLTTIDEKMIILLEIDALVNTGLLEDLPINA